MKIDANKLQTMLERSLLPHVPGASAAVFHDGALTTAAAGVINVTTGVAVTTDTVMHVGSIAKVFNATLIMQLVDKGQVDLEEKVAVYLPDLRLKDTESLAEITVRMLLNHTSGIDGNMLPDHGHDEEIIEKGILRFGDLGQIHRPGAEYSYCNAATVIAGYLAQRLTGKSWYRLVKEKILDPLQMEHAVALPEEALLHRAGVGHYRTAPPDRSWTRVSHLFLPLSFSPGGTTMMMSAVDLITFARTHMADGVGPNGIRILSDRGARAMREMTMNNRGKGYTYTDGIGIGWMVCEDGLLHHSGGGPGIFSTLYAHPERNFAAAILTNAEFGASCCAANALMQTWFREVGVDWPFNPESIRPPMEPVNVEPGRLTGVYENITDRYRISWTGDGMALSAQAKQRAYDYTTGEPTNPAHLIPFGRDRFLLAADRGGEDAIPEEFRIFTFRNPNAEGRMQHLGNGDRLYLRVA